MQTPLVEKAPITLPAAAEKEPKPPDVLKWMQTFALPPPGEFDQTAVRWEFGGKEMIPVRVTAIPAHRAEDIVAGHLWPPLHALSVPVGAPVIRHACTACQRGACLH